MPQNVRSNGEGIDTGGDALRETGRSAAVLGGEHAGVMPRTRGGDSAAEDGRAASAEFSQTRSAGRPARRAGPVSRFTTTNTKLRNKMLP